MLEKIRKSYTGQVYYLTPLSSRLKKQFALCATGLVEDCVIFTFLLEDFAQFLHY